ncbi:MAG: L-threonylcarbamoyladenylate synthase [Patescibacteria group bacterium]
MDQISINDINVLEKASQVLLAGGVIVVPTDTVYGLACDAQNTEAIERLFRIKERDRGKSIPVFVRDYVMLSEIARLGEPSATILFNFLPGPLTAVLQALGALPSILHKDTPNIGIRIPNYKFDLDLVEKFGRPLAVTSANISGKGLCTEVSAVINSFHETRGPDLLIDAGDLPESIASTVVDFTKIPPVVLREGPISKKDFFAVANQYYTPVNY